MSNKQARTGGKLRMNTLVRKVPNQIIYSSRGKTYSVRGTIAVEVDNANVVGNEDKWVSRTRRRKREDAECQVMWPGWVKA